MSTDALDTPEDAEGPVPQASAVKLSETLNILIGLRGRAENDWYRVIYLHAALIGVMIFFAGQTADFIVARLVVFAFYSFNVAVSFAALRDSHDGLRHATADLRTFMPSQGWAGIHTWLGSRDYGRSLRLQLVVLTAAWFLVAYLLLVPIIMGRTPLGLP